MRLFVAAFPSAEAVADLSAAVDRLAVAKARARVIPTERWHVTLAFLGDVPEDMIGPAAEALAAAPQAGPSVGELCVRGGGKFGRGPSTVLWAGLDGDLDGLIRLGRAVRRELRARRLHPDDKQFHAHLTLARPGVRVSAAAISADIELLRAYDGPWWPVSELTLVHSIQGPHPSYQRLDSVTL
jgi:2'-5' RNA ligase